MSEAHDGVGTLGEEAVRLLGAVSEAIAAVEPGRSPGPAPDRAEAAPAPGSWSEDLAALAEEAAEAWGSTGAGTADHDPAGAGRRDSDPDHGPGRQHEHAGHHRPDERDGGPRAASGGPCRWCPVCRAVHLLEETHPEVRVHLVSAARSLLRATAAVLEQLPPEDGDPAPGAPPDPGGEATGVPRTDRTTRRGPGRPPAARVEHIALDDDGPAGLGRTTGPEGRDEENW